ncbi:phage tail protein [Lactiplantibacillus plantarum]|uniref:phage tail protein n=1 Tax=Lactiplantibacillus plantarum TaxID=1590 RepID=UPI000B95A1DC|nr:phage tail protein [Lactiplantibacillus plantarum]MBP5839328.1 phage tail protein [Lactiplantibacillus plantarum]OYL11637.1 phage tail protein [Lactiplantibacillus plantarum]
MELEEIELLFKVNTEQMEQQFAKVQPMIDKLMGKTADSAKSGMDKTEQSMDISKGLKTIRDQLTQLNENIGSSFNKMGTTVASGSAKVGQATSKIFSGSRAKVKQDLEGVVAEIDAKMQQARAAQSKMRDLMNQKTSLNTAQQNGTQGIKIDNQVASAQAQMTRYQNQAKALAQSMRQEFKAVPDSLRHISKAMDQNEVKIETYRRQLKALQGSYRDVQDSMKTMGASDRLTKQSTALEKSIMSTRDKMNKLINSNDSLNKSYAYVSDRGDELKSVIGKLNTEMGESGTAATRAAGSYNRFGSAASSAMNKASGSGKGPSNWFSRISNGIQGATSRIRNFGNSSSSSMNKASSSARRTSGALGGIAQQLKYLPSQLIVFGLLYQGLTQLATGMMTAFKTNAQFASSLNQIKVNLLTAFYPIYNFVLPAVNALMSSLSKATSWLAQFTSALTGMSYSKARQGAQGLYEQSKALNDTAAASSKASASVKKANEEIRKQNAAQAKSVREANAQIRAQNQAQAASVREANRQIAESNKQGAAKVRAANAAIEAANKRSQASMEATKKKNKELMQSLMGFDELNVLDKSSDDEDYSYDKKPKETFTPQEMQAAPESTPTKSAPESTPLQSTDDIGSEAGNDGVNFGVPLGQSFNSATDAAKKLQKVLGELFDPMKAAWDAKGKSVVDAAKYAWKEVGRALGDVGRSFVHVWDNGTGQKTVEAILQLLADMLNIVGDIAKAFSQAWEGGGGRGTKLIQTIFNSLNDVLKLIHDIASSFRSAWNGGNLGERIFANLITLVTNLVGLIGDIAKAFDNAWNHGNTGTKLIQSILNALNAVIKVLNNIAVAFRNAWNSGAGEKIASNLYKIFTNIFNTVSALGGQFDKAWQHGGVGTSIFKTLLGMVNDMLGALNDMAGATVKWASKLDFTPLLQSIDRLLKAIRPVVKDVWDGLDWGYQNILLPLAKYTITNLIPTFFDALAAALKLVHSIIQASQPAFKWIWDSFLKPLAKWTGGVIVGVLKKLADALGGISSWVDKHHTAVEAMAKVLVTMFAFKVTMTGLSNGIGLLGKLADKAAIIGGKGHVLRDFFKGITGIDKLEEAVGSVKTLWSLAKMKWSDYAAALADGWKALKNWSIWSKLAAAGQAVLDAAMDANPIGLVVLAIAALVAGFVALYKHNKKFRDFCNSVWKHITKWFGDSIDWISKNWTKIIGFIINPVGTIASWFLKDTKTGKNILKWASKLPGKASDWAKSVGKKVGTHITNAKKDFQQAGKNIGNWTTGFVGGAKRIVNTWASNIGNGVHKKVSDGKKAAQEAGKKIGNWTSEFTSKSKGAIVGIRKWASNIGSNVNTKVEDGKRLAKNAGSKLGSWVNNFRTGASKTVSSWAGSLGSKTNSGMGSSRTAALRAGTQLGNWVASFRTGTGKTIAKWAGGLGGKIGGGLSSGWKSVKKGSADVANAIIGTIGKAVNGVIDGIKWILNHVGASSKAKSLSHWSVPSFATGGRHKGGPAIVNDQVGDKYREAYKLPNGRTGLFPAVRNMMVNLPRGTQILNAAQTARKATAMVPHYAGGIGDFDFDFSSIGNFNLPSFNFSMPNFGDLFSGIGDSVGSFANGVKDTASDIWDDVTHPEKVLKAAMNKFVKFTGLGGYPLDVAKSMVDFSVDSAKSWVGKILKEYGESEGPNGGAITHSMISRALEMTKVPKSRWSKMQHDIIEVAKSETGNRNITQTITDVNSLAGNPAGGPLQYVKSTFDAFAFPGHHNFRSSFDQVLAYLNNSDYYNAAGHTVIWGTPKFDWLHSGPIGHRRFANGGLVDAHQMIEVAEQNKPEMVLPLTNIPRSMQLIKQALSFMGQTFSDGLQMPTALTQSMDMSNLASQPSSTSTQSVNSGGINELGTSIVNALVQGLQMTNVGGSMNNQPINVNLTLQVGDEKFGNAAIKGINAVNQKNGKNMLRL